MKKTAAVLAILLVFTLCFSAYAEEKTTYTLGVCGDYNDYWEPVIEKLKEEGITLELVEFSSYPQPNRALADGEIDLNAFQHYKYLNSEIESNGYELSVVGDTIIAPLGLYSLKVKDATEIKEGDSIAIPNDPSNGGRALKLLETAGLLTMDPEVGYLGEKKDVTENPLNLEIIETDAAQLPSLLPDVTAAIINGGNALGYGYTLDDAIFIETPAEGSDNPYVNILVCRTAEKDTPIFAHILELLQTDEEAKLLYELYNGTIIPAWETTVTGAEEAAAQ
ncbi:MAG: MetQ/NlpA family ABC transporter substrate-binding protein [Eubacteriales bacterium]|nr:MetQ/NlpA family ABC transporter substrate-binding protein [Eubacteriales bacterium]